MKNIIIIILSFSTHVLPAQSLISGSPIDRSNRETILSRFSPPPGYQRIPADSDRFANWLRQLPLQPDSFAVHDYRGRVWKAAGDSTIAAVVAMDIRGKKLEQCMDIILRLRGEYLLEGGREDSIGFLMPDRTILRWRDWRDGWRPVRKGGDFPIKKIAFPDRCRQNYERYLQEIFYYAGTQTYYFGLMKVQPESLRIGDCLIKKGRRGHAVLIIDIAENANSDRVAIFAQGDTPACEMHILCNQDGSPWFLLDFSKSAPDLPIRKKMTGDGVRRF